MANRCLNKVMLIGNLTRDPELRYTPEGTAVCSFGMATNRSWVTNDGQKKDEVQYHRIVAWKKLAELCAKILTKGKKVYIEGRLTYRTFTGKDNQERTITEIILDDFISFDNRRKDESEIAKEEPGELETSEKLEAASQTNEKSAATSDIKSDEESSLDQEPESKTEDINPDDIPF